jgi:MFS family permease
MDLASAAQRRIGPFERLWLAYGVSSFGDQITLLALPLTAALTLHAGASAMGLLAAAGTLPQLLFSLPVGVLADRRARKPLMVAADAVRALVLLAVPALALLQRLSLPALDLIAFVSGCGAVLGGIATNSYLPALVGRERIVAAYSRLYGTDALARMAGPGVAGLLVQAVTAPIAVIADAVSFLCSALTVGFGVSAAEAASAAGEPQGMLSELLEGARFTLRNRLLRTIYVCGASLNLAGTAAQALLVLFAVRSLGLSAGGLGLALGAGSGGALLGACLAGRIATRLGIGRTAVCGVGLMAISFFAVPLAAGPALFAAVLVGGSEFIGGFGSLLFDVSVGGIRPALTPDALLGRTAAAARTVSQGTRPIGAILGGLLGTWLGLRLALWLIAAAGVLPLIWLLLSPLPALRTLPAAPDATVAA